MVVVVVVTPWQHPNPVVASMFPQTPLPMPVQSAAAMQPEDNVMKIDYWLLMNERSMFILIGFQNRILWQIIPRVPSPPQSGGDWVWTNAKRETVRRVKIIVKEEGEKSRSWWFHPQFGAFYTPRECMDALLHGRETMPMWENHCSRLSKQWRFGQAAPSLSLVFSVH